jgi:hypothetical protein
MTISAKCPKGHSAQIPDKFAGKTVRCPTCKASFTVPIPDTPSRPVAPAKPTAAATPAQTGTDAQGDSGILRLTPKLLGTVAAAWVGSLLAAVLLGAFVSRSLGPPIVVETVSQVSSIAAPVNSVSNAVPEKKEAFAGIIPGGAPGTFLSPEAGSGVSRTVVVGDSADWPPRAQTNRVQQRSRFEQEGSNPVPSATIALTPDQAEETLKADLREAIIMLEKQQYQLLLHDFMPLSEQLRNTNRGGPRSGSMSKEFVDDLKAHLQAALTGEMGFNRNCTLVEVHYVRQPIVVVPPGPPTYLPSFDDKPLGKVPGLGSDLSAMLIAAATLMRSDKSEEFIRNVYPYAEIARLSEADYLNRLVLRVNANPEMKTAMIRDLTAAAGVDPEVAGDTASVTLPALSPEDPPRVLKFQLVDGNWRFFDGRQETRQQYRTLVAADVPAVTLPGSRGTLLLSRSGENWRLAGPPSSEPLN